MSDRNFDLSRLAVGEVVRRDLKDGNGTLLLREGRAATSEKQLEMLIKNAAPQFAGVPGAAEPKYLPRSPLAMVLAARRRLQALLENPAVDDFGNQVNRLVGDIQKACRLNADVALAAILMCRDEPYPFRHPVNVAVACCVAGTTMQFDEPTLTSTMAAALTMNIGMLELQARLHALPGGLDGEQRAALQAHCARGADMLRELGVDDALWLEIVRDHHEHPDGSGYPAGKTAVAIGAPTQLVTLADIYCARVSRRVHRAAMQPRTALRWLFLNEGTCVDEHHAALFIKALGIHPPGTAVRLRSGSIGVVINRGQTGQQPVVASITTQDGMRAPKPIRRDTGSSTHAIADVVDLDELGIPVSMEALWGSDAVV